MSGINRIVYGKQDNLNELNRDRWVIEELSKLKNGSSIIDCGAGECKYKPYCKHLEYKSQDFCQYDGTGIDVGLQTGSWDVSHIDIVSDITCIPVEDQSFDSVLCTEVLEHIPYPELALKEFYRILKPGGKLILTAPFASWTHFAPYHYCSGFNSFWYEHHLEKLGFELLVCEENGNYYSLMNQEINRLMLSKNGHKNLKMVLGGRLVKSYLKRQEKKIDDFNKLACFGFHVVAIKKGLLNEKDS